KAEWHFAEAEEGVDKLKTLVKAVRNLRAEMDVPPSRKAKFYMVSELVNVLDQYQTLKQDFMTLISASEFVTQEDTTGIPETAVSVVIPNAVVYVPLEDLVDMEKEKERLTKEKEKLEKEVARSNGMLSNEKFLSKAPEAKVAEEKAKLEKYKQMLADVEERLAQIK
ncbi:MAG: valine--tRNA ligase, partial [Eubacterium sp.]|nr:valine--tRNA ligase [Eubacterium sp.]